MHIYRESSAEITDCGDMEYPAEKPTVHHDNLAHFQGWKLLFTFMTTEYLMLVFRSAPTGWKQSQL